MVETDKLAHQVVTLEHEYILIFRKGKKRIFTTPQAKLLRRQSALFWEERNKWYADRWDLSGVRQYLGTKGTEAERTRSAAFPLELAYRLINMYSVQGDTVIDPFAGTGTTLLASLAACRGSLGMEIDPALGSVFVARAAQFIPVLNEFILARLHAHLQFARDQETRNTPLAYRNSRYGFPVKTRQETDLFIPCINGVEMTQPYSFSATYTDQIFLQESPRPVLRPFNLFPGSALRTQATGA
jgi:hypothetical protein